MNPALKQEAASGHWVHYLCFVSTLVHRGERAIEIELIARECLKSGESIAERSRRSPARQLHTTDLHQATVVRGHTSTAK